jgi:hypothetical protein
MENTTTDNNAINICKFSGIFLSFALSIGAMCVGYQPIAGIIFLASILILIGLTYLSFPTFQLNDYNAGLTSYTFLYILVSSIYTNDISLKGGFSLSALFKSFGFLSVILSAISVIINISYLIVTQKDNLQYYFRIYLIYGLIGLTSSWFVCNINPTFSLINTSQVSTDNSQCSSMPATTFKCSFISNEDGTEINLEDIMN